MVALTMTMKGLPLAYSKDMQDDKPPVFEAHDLLALSIAAMTGMVETTQFVPERMRAAAEAGFSTATDLADWLVREGDMPFREAHHITGRAVKLAESEGVRARRAAARGACRRSTRGSTSASSTCCRSTPRSRAGTSHGGTAPDQVRARIAEARSEWSA